MRKSSSLHTWSAGQGSAAKSESPSPADPVVEVVDREHAALHAKAWRDLASRCLDPNPFMDPGFCLVAADHLPAPASLVFVMMWDGVEQRRLIGVVPLVRSKLPRWPLAGLWFHDLAALGGPMLDRDRARAACDALLSWMSVHLASCAALLMPTLDRNGPTALLLADIAIETGRALAFLDERRRAVLKPGGGSDQAGVAALSRRRAKEILRQGRRLAEIGEVRYASVTQPAALSGALKTFLDLEALGWKGRAGTALRSDEARAAFVRDMVDRMAADGRCRIDALTVGGVPVAMGILLVSGDRQFFWKTAFAEEHAALSPGVQFVIALTEAQRNLGIASTDSCAIPDHPMIDRLWPQRLTVADVLIEIRPGSGRRFRWALAMERTRRRARSSIKDLYRRLRDRRRRAGR